jgi:hypothetical protein
MSIGVGWSGYVCIWGGEPRINLEREFGYGGGSAITQIIRRLETRVQADPALRENDPFENRI